jgi:hypothetical protein
MENHAMRILFVSKQVDHPVAYALTGLGHEVACLDEAAATAAVATESHDFLLFTDWEDWTLLVTVDIPKVFWKFGFIDHAQDPALGVTSVERPNWIVKALALSDLGFCTDGDFVRRHPEKLITLHAAADERLCGPGVADASSYKKGGILFFGSEHGHGSRRSSFVGEMKLVYANKFTHVEDVQGRELASLIAGHEIVVAPHGPVSAGYWPDRVYVTLGMGGFLIHPLCADLAWEYQGAGKDSLGELAYYKDRAGLHSAVKFYLQHPEDRKLISERGLLRTTQQHTYTHRCARLAKIVEQRVLKGGRVG